ncbi:DUF2065 domain-containing protein [Paremcibacter congregatus]|mgnify:CR=1 FL=1|jgi:uncharacterized protein YjeT (DUF2065 family)|uniref:DUF2065 domain-containing protein n=1 Tax=Paremcibacter congregatus TaxID=2043170 RepID=A0A2G4YRR5_9PROT|nr:DUF2065 domain-containing protein [Paremcibacter congregatus]PHZ84950.1 hypothetical protein CRD36_09510 [Paremcibacter congregatus]QDE26075.1 DUF2065 domain-containing protein [Paremcibacter congregatus]|tara:strand:- start:6692 stop:6877 length:186 start_codon:yes stop_codon:yes gene_type:complete
MQDIILALGAVFLVEGILYTLFPEAMRRMMKQVIQMPENAIRYSGLAAAVIGFLVIYAVKQ